MRTTHSNSTYTRAPQSTSRLSRCYMHLRFSIFQPSTDHGRESVKHHALADVASPKSCARRVLVPALYNTKNIFHPSHNSSGINSALLSSHRIFNPTYRDVLVTAYGSSTLLPLMQTALLPFRHYHPRLFLCSHIHHSHDMIISHHHRYPCRCHCH